MAHYPVQNQYPQMPPTAPIQVQTYQQIAEPKYQEIIACGSNQDVKKHKGYDVNFRIQWGPEVAIDVEGLGITPEQEIARTNALQNLINPEVFPDHTYSKPFFAAVKMNNAIYSFTYQFFFTFLAFFAGIWISFGMALGIAVAEFTNQFIFRPAFRMIRIYAGFATLSSQIAYECLRPVFALFMPWNKQ
mmetsp:Transcript_10597/g.14509  ORF Transcript_10597/g.14509 Transcript_10597/m.14509 type:complete len:189 (+) Transcript_10597:52-618(+)